VRKKVSKKFKNNKKSSKKSSRFSFRFIIFSVLILFIFSYGYIQYQYSSKSLTYLPIPQIAEIYLPDPLELASISSSVLGAQTIDPKDIVKYVNIERAKVGSKELRISPILMQAAQLRADVILKYQNFSHQDPHENIELTTVLPKLDYQFRYASENIGMGGLSGEDFVGGFMNSTSHRENLLSPHLADTGVAVVTGPYKQYYVNIAVQLFAIPGGKKEYLGYSDKETSAYKKQLSDLDAKLNPIVWNMGKLTKNKQNSNEKYKTLSRQREILKTIYSHMTEEKPLTNEHVALIAEYNSKI